MFPALLLYLFVCVLTASAAGQSSIPADDERMLDSANGDVAVDAGPNDQPTEPPPERNWQLTRGAKEFNFEGGYSPVQPTFFSGRKEYDTDGRKYAMTSFRFGRVIGTAKGVTYEYMFEVMPFSLALENEVRPSNAEIDESKSMARATIRRNTYGFGVEPAIFRFIFLPRRRIKPYVQTGAGFLFTKKPVPVPESPRYNFIGDFGGGMMFSLTERRVMNVGYRYFHISNMNIGVINPGYNANVFQIGFSLFSK